MVWTLFTADRKRHNDALPSGPFSSEGDTLGRRSRHAGAGQRTVYILDVLQPCADVLCGGPKLWLRSTLHDNTNFLTPYSIGIVEILLGTSSTLT